MAPFLFTASWDSGVTNGGMALSPTCITHAQYIYVSRKCGGIAMVIENYGLLRICKTFCKIRKNSTTTSSTTTTTTTTTAAAAAATTPAAAATTTADTTTTTTTTTTVACADGNNIKMYYCWLLLLTPSNLLLPLLQ